MQKSLTNKLPTNQAFREITKALYVCTKSLTHKSTLQKVVQVTDMRISENL